MVVAHADDSALRALDDRDEQWVRLLRWLQREHGMDVGRSGLLVERRDAEGASAAFIRLELLLISSQEPGKGCLP